MSITGMFCRRYGSLNNNLTVGGTIRQCGFIWVSKALLEEVCAGFEVSYVQDTPPPVSQLTSYCMQEENS